MAPQQPGAGAPTMPQQLNPDQLRKMQVMVKQAMGLLLQDDTAEHLVAKAKQGEPQQVVAEVVSGLLGQLYQAATEAGQEVDMVTMMVTGIQIIGTLAEMLAHEGVIPQEQLPQFVAAAGKIAVDQHNATVQGGAQQQPTGSGAAMAGGMIGGAAA
jgi:hypothetical protein